VLVGVGEQPAQPAATASLVIGGSANVASCSSVVTPFLASNAVKVALAAGLLPTAWRLTGRR